jgi:hypothetical protein
MVFIVSQKRLLKGYINLETIYNILDCQPGDILEYINDKQNK